MPPHFAAARQLREVRSSASCVSPSSATRFQIYRVFVGTHLHAQVIHSALAGDRTLSIRTRPCGTDVIGQVPQEPHHPRRIRSEILQDA